MTQYHYNDTNKRDSRKRVHYILCVCRHFSLKSLKSLKSLESLEFLESVGENGEVKPSLVHATRKSVGTYLVNILTILCSS